MKKMVFFLLSISFTAFASTGWFSDYVKINKNGSGEAYYWIGSNPSFGTELNSLNMGVVTSLVITGCDMKYWSDNQDRTGGSFFYIIKNSTGTSIISGPTEIIWSQVYTGGNDYQGTSTNSINLLSGLTANTTYQLHVYAKSWGTSQGDSYLSNGGLNYVATFTTDAGLPVELSSFAAMAKGKDIELAWQTASEVNNHGFEIERKQSGAASWETIGFKQGQGTSNTKNDYSFVDNSAATGKYSYRLKQIDRDGKFEYSRIVEAVSALSPSSVELKNNFPNPFNPSTSISFILGTTGKASLKVFDVLGKEVAVVAEGIFNAGELNTVTFNAEKLTSGVYYYRLTSGTTIETRKMLLMK